MYNEEMQLANTGSDPRIKPPSQAGGLIVWKKFRRCLKEPYGRFTHAKF